MPEKNTYTHDSGYKLLFSNHELVRQLITSFVTDDWVREIEHLCFCYGPEALNEPLFPLFCAPKKVEQKRAPASEPFWSSFTDLTRFHPEIVKRRGGLAVHDTSCIVAPQRQHRVGGRL